MNNRLSAIFHVVSRPLLALTCLLLCASAAMAQHTPVKKRHPHVHELSDSVAYEERPDSVAVALGEADFADGSAVVDSLATATAEADSLAAAVSPYDRWEEREVAFNPDPNRAVWMSALFPGLGQLYNRRFWKLPIVIGGYLGLSYATSWNNSMLTDYTKAYRDIMDSDPGTNSYMNFFPPTTSEADLDKTWLTNILQNRKNYFRRNRDLCIIGMIGVYLIAMVDAYVDAQLSHFDISPDLSMDLTPALMQDVRDLRPSVGLVWAINF